ncbi:SMI1/KNR4 family protein [Actinoplanes derwentensis]|uniref:Cell wall assembly regulator SMI1 n=1 Tax=Actinoplanes derwentensis TaxID=113562 RepID=A0A1H1SAA2_9ACTN|nr:SMI1/KNR4 family protein [Actinoplanes derwentensis]GID83357.1 hypothetical protein Ade03nite_22810 [Actinoplanes derwentensis]SDS44728.1 Cell wall assembly regulator SMI1 [Actinoplanes derwentensis]
MTRSVADSWTLIDDWLHQHVPHVHATLAPPATAADLQRVEQAHGVDLPGDLIAWWRGANGMRPGSMSYAQIVPPGLWAMNTEFAVAHLHETRQLATGPQTSVPIREYDATVAELMNEPAGSPDQSGEGVLVHLPAWFAFAYENRVYFVDYRPGPLQGCVMRQGAYGGWSGPLWPSLAAMWAETSDVLLSSNPGSRPERVKTTVGDWWFPQGWWPES